MLRLLDELGLLDKLFVMRLGLLSRKLEFFGFDGGPHLGGLEVEQRLVPIRLGAAHQLNVRFFSGGQVRFHLLYIGVQLDHRVLIIVQPVYLVLAIELGHHFAFLYVFAGCHQIHQD